jgi:site-specific recombinase XerD
MKRPAEPLTKKEIWAIINAFSMRTPTGVRNRALVMVLWRSGLRIKEALSLRVADIDFEEGSLRVLHGKGDKSRTAFIDRAPLEYVRTWIDKRNELQIGPVCPLFCTLRGGPIDSSYVRHMLPRIAVKAGIVKRVHAHGLRHTHAAELRREGVDIGAISKQLGHSSISTTSRYLDHIAPAEVSKAIRSRKLK